MEGRKYRTNTALYLTLAFLINIIVIASLVSPAIQADQPVFDEAPASSPESEPTPASGRNQQRQQQRLYNRQGEAEQGNQSDVRKYLRNAINVNVPLFYDMVKNGTSMGINVLSGLVKVERGEEATRSGLQGPRPLSVRIFGVPVYERGTRVRDPSSEGNSGSSIFSILSSFGGNRPQGTTGGGEPEADVASDGLDER